MQGRLAGVRAGTGDRGRGGWVGWCGEETERSFVEKVGGEIHYQK